MEALLEKGACVAAFDIDPSVAEDSRPNVLGVVCDVTDKAILWDAIGKVVFKWGGIDMLVSNAGMFPKSMVLEDMEQELWEKSMKVNLTSHQALITKTLPFIELGIDPAIVLIASKNVPAPGPGAAAYSVAKAGLTQLGRVAALELGKKGIRVNMIHPNAVYDTSIWTDEVLNSRAENYGLTVEAYKTNNALKVEVTSKDVAELTVSMLGKTFSKITGAQVPIDGGNDRVI